MKYTRVILKTDNVSTILNRYGFKQKTKFSFYDLIYVNKNGASITDDTLKIRVYQINEWKTKDVLVIKKIALTKDNSKEDKVLLKKEFDSEKEAVEFVNNSYGNEYKFALKLKKDGIEYANENVRLWYEKVDNVGISVEIGASTSHEMESIVKELDVKERLSMSLPEYMYNKKEAKNAENNEG